MTAYVASRKIADKDDERRPGYANINEDILLRFKSSVDALLSAGAPEVPDQFAAVHRRLRDAASVPDAPLGED